MENRGAFDVFCDDDDINMDFFREQINQVENILNRFFQISENLGDTCGMPSNKLLETQNQPVSTMGR